MSEQMQEKQQDPVCRMEVKPLTAAAESEYQGKTYYFCSRQCRDAFEANPQKYVQQQEQIR